MIKETKLGLYHFKLLYDIMHDIHMISYEEKLISYIIEKVSRAIKTQSGTIFMINYDGILEPVASYGMDLEVLKKYNFKPGEGIVGWVLENKKALKIDKPLTDNRFNGRIDKDTGFITKNIIAAPIVTQEKILGVLELINREGGPFVGVDLEFTSIVGQEIGIAVEHIRVLRKLEEKQVLEDALVSSLGSGIIIVNNEGLLAEINPHAVKMLELEKVDRSRNRPYMAVLGSCCTEFLEIIENLLVLDSPLKRQEVKVNINGKDKVFGYSCAPLYSAGSRVGSALLFQDITKIVMSVKSVKN